MNYFKSAIGSTDRKGKAGGRGELTGRTMTGYWEGFRKDGSKLLGSRERRLADREGRFQELVGRGDGSK